MTPATRNFDIYQGAKWEHTFTFKVSGTETPIDLTGLGPFVFTVKKSRSDDLYFNATVTSDYDDTGVVTVTISAEDSARLPLSPAVRYGFRDALNNPYMVGELVVKFFAPEPA
jgi:hypothetical protein